LLFPALGDHAAMHQGDFTGAGMSGDGDQGDGATVLDRQVRRQLGEVNHPARNWVPETVGPDGRAALDVAIIGAGMAGITLAHALLRDGIVNIRLFDRAAPGQEGPWVTYARMETLRSPKHLTGPDLGLAGLTFRAWFEARHGEAGWDALAKIDRRDWMDYLVWVRRTLDLPVENGVELVRVTPTPPGAAAGLLCLDFENPQRVFRRYARKLVLATGRDGSGEPCIPDFIDPSLRPGRIAHSADPIDFASLRGRRVAVLGASASAWDNAATALEAGAAHVDLFVRRAALPQVNKFKAVSYPGFLQGFQRLSDEQRWRMLHYAFEERVPPPRETVMRTARHPNFTLHFSAGWRQMAALPEELRIQTAKGVFSTDFAILGTGFTVDLARRTELAGLSGHIALWSDMFRPPVGFGNAAMAAFPYLGPGFQFMEKAPGAAPCLRNIHCFNFGATISHGTVSGDIPGIQAGAKRLAAALLDDLFAADIDRHVQAMVEAAEPELLETPWYVPPASA
jgi:cation diffusion facilitator CzcD-associated flavoprotein CzcO